MRALVKDAPTSGHCASVSGDSGEGNISANLEGFVETVQRMMSLDIWSFFPEGLQSMKLPNEVFESRRRQTSLRLVIVWCLRERSE